MINRRTELESAGQNSPKRTRFPPDVTKQPGVFREAFSERRDPRLAIFFIQPCIIAHQDPQQDDKNESK